MKPYDPKLREAGAEFKALCAKYDCAGICLFVSPTHAEYINEFSPSWSVIRPEGEGGIRFRSKREDFPTREAQHEATEASAHLLTSIVEWSRQTQENFLGVLFQLKEKGLMKIMWSAWDKPDSVPGDGL